MSCNGNCNGASGCNFCSGEGALRVANPVPIGVTPRSVPACNGMIPAGLAHAFTLRNSEAIAPGAERTMFIGTFQPTQLINIVQITTTFAPGEVEITDLQYNETSVLPKAKSESSDVVKTMGDFSRYTDDATFAGTTPIYKATPLADQVNQLGIVVRNNTAVAIPIGGLQFEVHMKAPALHEVLCTPADSRGKNNPMGKCWDSAVEHAMAAWQQFQDNMKAMAGG